MGRVKTTHYNEAKIKTDFLAIMARLRNYTPAAAGHCDFQRISNHTFWYTEERLLRLAYLYNAINECGANADFFNVALSEVVREVSFTRNSEFKRYKMSEAQIQRFAPDVFKLFETKVVRNINGLEQFNSVTNGNTSRICDFNTVEGIPTEIVAPESVDMVITSPPYGDSRTTVAYGQFSRWSNEWFGFCQGKDLDSILMGGRRFAEETFKTESIAKELGQIKEIDDKRYAEVVSFLSDYSSSISNVAAAVRLGGVVCYVVGNRTVKGVQIPLDYFTAEMFSKLGYRHIDTIVREIPNKRMPLQTSPTNMAGAKMGTMVNEYIVIMKKVE